MKKIVLTLLAAITLSMTASAAGISVKRDTTGMTSDGEPIDRIVVVNGTDTTVVIESSEAGDNVIARVKGLNNHLDDTIINLSGTGDVDIDNENFPFSAEDTKEIAQRAENTATAVKETLNFIAFCIVLIVGLCLLFYYLHRRRRYKAVEAAIAAGYPLPPEFYGRNATPQPYVVTPEATQSAPSTAIPPQQPPMAAIPPVDDYWRTMSSGYKLIAVGAGLIIFFLILGLTPMAGVMSIILLLGIGKCAIAYQQRGRVATQQPYYQPYNAQQQAQPAQQQPVETPPAFRYGEESEPQQPQE